MEEHRPKPTKAGLLRTIRILWFALLVSLFLYALVGYMVKDNIKAELDVSFLNLMAMMLAMVAVVVTLVVMLIGRFWSTRELPTCFAYSILRYALAESICIFGLILFFLGASWQVYAVFWGWSFCLMLFLIPTEGGIDRFLGRNKMTPV